MYEVSLIGLDSNLFKKSAYVAIGCLLALVVA